MITVITKYVRYRFEVIQSVNLRITKQGGFHEKSAMHTARYLPILCILRANNQTK